MEKRGEITSTQIALVVLAIIGFAMVLYLLLSVDLGGLSADETCHLSVITRASVPAAAQGIVPLKCTTKKICITDKFLGGRCEKQFAGESDIEIVRVWGDSVKEKRRVIEETSANAMYDCWSMMGQGKLDIFGGFYESQSWSPSTAHCVICSRIAIDGSINDSVLYEKKVSSTGAVTPEGVDVNNYLRTNKVPGKDITYLQAFTDKGMSAYAKATTDLAGNAARATAYESLKTQLGTNPAVEQVMEEIKKEIEIKGTNVNREISFVFMQIKAPSQKITEDILKSIGAAGATAAGATFMMPVIGRFGTALYVGLAATIAGSGSEIYGAFNTRESQISAAGYCGAFASTEKDVIQGCSVVEAVNYKFKPINAMCKVIEGNP